METGSKEALRLSKTSLRMEETVLCPLITEGMELMETTLNHHILQCTITICLHSETQGEQLHIALPTLHK